MNINLLMLYFSKKDMLLPTMVEKRKNTNKRE
jgi:hypothetical protein